MFGKKKRCNPTKVIWLDLAIGSFSIAKNTRSYIFTKTNACKVSGNPFHECLVCLNCWSCFITGDLWTLMFLLKLDRFESRKYFSFRNIMKPRE